MMGWVCSANLGRKREMAVSWLMRRCSSLTLLGLHISMIALHFSRLPSMLRCVSMKSKNLPQSTLKMNISGLRRRLYCRNLGKTVDKY